jgi:putative transposase
MTKVRGIVPGEYYHVFNRSARKLSVFQDKNDWLRSLFFILHYQSPLLVRNTARIIEKASGSDGFPIPFETAAEIIEKRFVELTAFCIMPNHFHLLVKEVEEGGLAQYLHRVQLAYTMYFNEKRETSGHVFQGRYKTVHVQDDRQLMYLSAYIHRNPHELKEWKGKEETYPWSSLQDYVTANRWGGLLATDIIASRFAQTPNSNYRDFVRTSGAKTLSNELEGVLLG